MLVTKPRNLHYRSCPFTVGMVLVQSAIHPIVRPAQCCACGYIGPRALSGKKKNLGNGVKNVVRPSVRLERSEGEEAWGEKVEGIVK